MSLVVLDERVSRDVASRELTSRPLGVIAGPAKSPARARLRTVVEGGRRLFLEQADLLRAAERALCLSPLAKLQSERIKHSISARKGIVAVVYEAKESDSEASRIDRPMSTNKPIAKNRHNSCLDFTPALPALLLVL